MNRMPGHESATPASGSYMAAAGLDAAAATRFLSGSSFAPVAALGYRPKVGTPPHGVTLAAHAGAKRTLICSLAPGNRCLLLLGLCLPRAA